jgi:hypothetical protein
LETVQGRHGKPTISNNASLYRRRRFPPEVIAHGVWLYLRFPLGPRVLALRGIDITYQTIPHWPKNSADSLPSTFVVAPGHFANFLYVRDGYGAIKWFTPLILLCHDTAELAGLI